MSKGRTQNSDTETQFLRSLQEVLRDMDKAHHTQTRILIHQTRRMGVFDVKIDSWLVVDDRVVARLLQTAGTFPNAQAKTMAAFLFSEAQKHALRLEEAIRSEAADIINHWFGPTQ